MSEEPVEERPSPWSWIRRVVLRGAIFGLLAAALVFSLVLPAAYHKSDAGFYALAAFVAGFSIQLGSLGEVLGGRWSSRGTHLAAAAGAVLVGAGMFAVASVELAYTVTLADSHGDYVLAAKEAVEMAKVLWRSSDDYLAAFGFLAFPFAPATYARLQRRKLSRQVEIVLAASAIAATLALPFSHVVRTLIETLRVLGVYIWSVTGSWIRASFEAQTAFFAALVLGEGLALPFVFRLADVVDGRVSAWLARRGETT